MPSQCAGTSSTSGQRCVFVYGTLMDDALVLSLTGRRFRKQAAVLIGYGKRTPAGGYPYVVPGAGEMVEGFVLHSVDAEALHRFDQYEVEGQLYRRTDVTVLIDGEPHASVVYVGIPEAVAER